MIREVIEVNQPIVIRGICGFKQVEIRPVISFVISTVELACELRGLYNLNSFFMTD